MKYTILLKGGLGNQMFQYAFARALSLRMGGECVLDTTFLNDKAVFPGITKRHYEMHIFNFEPRFTLLSRVSSLLPLPLLWFGMSRVFSKALSFAKIRRHIRFDEHYFDPRFLEVRENAYFEGYYQSPKYFEDFADEIRKDFSFRGQLPAVCESVARKIASTDSVVLAIRRGDSMKNPKAGFTGLEYYDRALAAIKEKVANPHLFVFTEEVEWARENIKTDLPIDFITYDQAEEPTRDHFRLMTMCKHFIIANSSYSWWAAWLASNPGKVVIAPAQYAADGSIKSEDILPKGWVAL